MPTELTWGKLKALLANAPDDAMMFTDYGGVILPLTTSDVRMDVAPSETTIQIG